MKLNAHLFLYILFFYSCPLLATYHTEPFSLALQHKKQQLESFFEFQNNPEPGHLQEENLNNQLKECFELFKNHFHAQLETNHDHKLSLSHLNPLEFEVWYLFEKLSRTMLIKEEFNRHIQTGPLNQRLATRIEALLSEVDIRLDERSPFLQLDQSYEQALSQLRSAYQGETSGALQTQANQELLEDAIPHLSYYLFKINLRALIKSLRVFPSNKELEFVNDSRHETGYDLLEGNLNFPLGQEIEKHMKKLAATQIYAQEESAILPQIESEISNELLLQEIEDRDEDEYITTTSISKTVEKINAYVNLLNEALTSIESKHIGTHQGVIPLVSNRPIFIQEGDSQFKAYQFIYQSMCEDNIHLLFLDPNFHKHIVAMHQGTEQLSRNYLSLGSDKPSYKFCRHQKVSPELIANAILAGRIHLIEAAAKYYHHYLATKAGVSLDAHWHKYVRKISLYEPLAIAAYLMEKPWQTAHFCQLFDEMQQYEFKKEALERRYKKIVLATGATLLVTGVGGTVTAFCATSAVVVGIASTIATASAATALTLQLYDMHRLIVRNRSTKRHIQRIYDSYHKTAVNNLVLDEAKHKRKLAQDRDQQITTSLLSLPISAIALHPVAEIAQAATLASTAIGTYTALHTINEFTEPETKEEEMTTCP